MHFISTGVFEPHERRNFGLRLKPTHASESTVSWQIVEPRASVNHSARMRVVAQSLLMSMHFIFYRRICFRIPSPTFILECRRFFRSVHMDQGEILFYLQFGHRSSTGPVCIDHRDILFYLQWGHKSFTCPVCIDQGEILFYLQSRYIMS